jgi:uncharacterized membrane protein
VLEFIREHVFRNEDSNGGDGGQNGVEDGIADNPLSPARTGTEVTSSERPPDGGGRSGASGAAGPAGERGDRCHERCVRQRVALSGYCLGMANSVTVENDVNVPSDVAFAYLSDYTKIADWLYGLSELKPLTEQTRGVGAKFDGTIKLGAKLQSLLEVIEFEEGRLMVLDSYKGIKNKSRWEVTPNGATSCTIKVTWEYDLGAGIAGKALGKVVEPVVKIAAGSSTKSLKDKLEAL